MTNTTELDTPASSGSSSSRGSLSTMKLDELKALAGTMGISGTSKMRKSDVLAAIRERGGKPAGESAPRRSTSRRATAGQGAAEAKRTTPDKAPEQAAPQTSQGDSDKAADRSNASERAPQTDRAPESKTSTGGPSDSREKKDVQSDSDTTSDVRSEQDGRDRTKTDDGEREGRDQRADGDRRTRQGNQNRGGGQGNRQNDRQNDDGQGNQNRGGGQGNRQSDRQNDRWNDDSAGGGRRRRQRGRDRKRGRGRDDFGGDVDTQIYDGDVLVPVAGILDVLDNYAFVRTSGYLSGSNDVYVPLGMVRKSGLRKGDAITGAVRALREGEQPPARQKFNALVRLDTINGLTIEKAKERVEFGKLTPLYPQERLRLETEQNILTTRIIDLVAPIGKGQRGLIVAPAKAGKTMVMQSLANAITENNPECHLMVVLVDERPEEVTEMQRAVKGEVISSTFDRPATDHTAVAELSIERAKRLVEMGHDVVLLLDSITKLGRAYNLAAPASGRILSGGVDSAALYPPKKFFGAARNIENGGSLTILATALIETGSKMDEVIFEEFKGTGNMELRLSRQLSERRIFPAVDVNASGTRREEILLGADELKIMWKLRRVLAALDQQQGIELLLDRLKKTKSNLDFLMQVQQTSSIKLDDED